MRWDNLRIEAEEGARLPGYRDPAVIRTFDAPEALGTRFYEVNAKSAINQVPKRSRMPFRYTINPYRGCSHACVYCADGETQILLADGRQRDLAELAPGDAILGTVRRGRYRRFVATTVLARWATRKDAYRVTLEDGTELIASGDHRFLTDRGWKHVTGADCGAGRRSHLTSRNKLLGIGALPASPEHDEGYRRGYLCGMLRGDGTWRSYSYARTTPGGGNVHRFRLALADLDGLARSKRWLHTGGIETDEFAFSAASGDGRTRAVRAIRTSKRAGVDAVRAVVAWPRGGSDQWCKGFLAGIFDAEGSHSCGVLRISNSNREILDWTRWCLRRLGVPHVLEGPWPNRVSTIRVTGGLRERLRFLHSIDPAITRKRTCEGLALKSDAPLGVAGIEPLGPRDLFDITTGSGDFIANGVVSHNCFARPTHTYLDLNAREDFEREIVVKVNVPERLRAELRKPSWKGAHVALGTNTDPYQWVEGRYKLTRGVWEAMRDFRNPCSVLTKSPLLLRDLDLFRELAERTEFVANLSIPTLEEKAWRATEPHTPHPRKRIEAVADLVRNGIPTGVLVAPLMPGINDDPKQVEELLGLLGEAGAGSVAGIGLHLRGEVREIWFDWLRQYRPDLVSHYEELYAKGAYLPSEERNRLAKLARGRRRPRRFTVERGTEADPTPARSEPSPASQPTLF